VSLTVLLNLQVIRLHKPCVNKNYEILRDAVRIQYKLLHLMKMKVTLPCWMIGVVLPSSSFSIIKVMNLSITDMSMSPR